MFNNFNKLAAMTAPMVFAASMLTASPASAADSCGFFAFAGAFKSFEAANQRADEIGGSAWGLDSSNSPNAGKGFWVVAKGPGSRSEAKGWRDQYRSFGVSGAYVANRCFYGE